MILQPHDHDICTDIGKDCDCHKRPLIHAQEQLHVEAGLRRYDPARKPMFKRILAVGGKVLVIGLSLSIIGHALGVFHRHRHASGVQFGPITSPPNQPYRDTDLPLPKYPDRLECVVCTNWTEYFDFPAWTTEPFGAETSFSLPVDADGLYLLARGSNQLGHLSIVQSTKVSNVADVNIRVAYRSEEALDLASVCLTKSPRNEYGIGIFTPERRRWSDKEYLSFTVELTLPAGKGGGSLNIKKLQTELPNYSQVVADLSKTAFFDLISLQSTSGHITVESVTSAAGSFKSTNGGITGSVSAEESLEVETTNGAIVGSFSGPLVVLETSNGAILANVTLMNQLDNYTSKLVMHTSNGRVESQVALISDSTTSGKFDVDVKSTNGGLDIAFVESPVGALLNFRGKTTLGAVDVALAPEYEGSFSASTVLGKASLSRRDVEDPAGRDRRRVLTLDRGKDMRGMVYWVESDGSHEENESAVQISTTIASVQLII